MINRLVMLMRSYLILIFLLLALSGRVYSLIPDISNNHTLSDDLSQIPDLFEKVQQEITWSTSLTYSKCKELRIDRSMATGSVKDVNGKEIEITVVTLDHADQLFHQMATQKHIPFAYPEDGCYARAHEMSRLLEQQGIITGKVFIEGNLRVETSNSPKGYVEWWYHVAPIIKVKGDGEGRDQVYVIDPSIFNRPVPVEEWYDIQTLHADGARDEVYQTRRFNYSPSTKSHEMKDYNQDDVENMEKTMQDNLKLQHIRQQREQNTKIMEELLLGDQ
ncbi:MAG: hypothetical protein HN353_04960 [Bdellovibrionales bacterium]|nr:hypothetical protein [Bdellovibrionales bacterium]MBT3527363.1 hypothetical protein [Bdellovibrionales bacterium]MBT7669529.1 hypothetical protein [Bdellovibrionales bacterium]